MLITRLPALSRRAATALVLALVLTLGATACGGTDQTDTGNAPSANEPVEDTGAGNEAPNETTEDEGYPGEAEAQPAMADPTDGAYPADEDAPADDAAPDDTAMTTDLEGRTLVIGTDPTYPPFETTNDAGEIVGIDPDLMAAICERANCTAEFRATSWDGIFAALGANEFDALMSAITILPEREEESNATFTDPYFEVGQVILTRSDEDRVSGVEDLSSVVVGVQTGTTGDTAAVEEGGVSEDEIRRFENIALAVQALTNGDIDAVVLDDPTAAAYASRFQDELTVIGPPFTVERYGILVPDRSPEVRAALNAAIAELRAEGRIEEIAAQWTKIEAPADEEGTDSEG